MNNNILVGISLFLLYIHKKCISVYFCYAFFYVLYIYTNVYYYTLWKQKKKEQQKLTNKCFICIFFFLKIKLLTGSNVSLYIYKWVKVWFL